jgi:hypothetical protein
VRGGELLFHFINVAILTAVIAPLVLWRYRRAVLRGMQDRQGAPLAYAPAHRATRADRVVSSDPLVWEAGLRRRVFTAVVAATLPSSLLLSALFLYLGELPMLPAQLLLQACVTSAIAVPIYAVLMAVPFWRAARLFLAFMVVAGAGLVVVSMLQRLLMGRHPSLDQALNFFYFFQLAAATLWAPMLVGMATGARRVRGVAPLIFAGLLLFGLAPYIGIVLTQAFTRTRAGSQLVLSFMGADTGFVLLSLPMGLIAWQRLKSLARGYDAKRFSDALMLARTWWLLIVVIAVIDLIAVYDRLPLIILSVVVGVASYLLFPILLARALPWANPARRRPPQRTLLVLRVFGYTSRTERLFDRIASRWRLLGPVTMIAAPDVIARTVDPGDFLRFATGNIATSFVNSREDVDRRLAALDVEPDPDGRYRVNELCCRDTTWQATVIELIDRADAVIMDVRGFTSQRRGCEFELQELAARLDTRQVVLIVDRTTDRESLEATIALSGVPIADRPMRMITVEKSTTGETDAAFAAVIHAAYPPQLPATS